MKRFLALSALSCVVGAASAGASTGADSPAYLQQQGETRRPLMSLLDRAGIGSTLDDAKIRVGGWAEGSYTYNFQEPADDLNLGRVFDVEHDDLTFNQLDIFFERLAQYSATDLDWGFRVEMMYGGDARFIHANGLLDHHADDGENDPTDPTDDELDLGPDHQFDLVQVYGDVNLPVGNGLRIRAGKFLFFKQINPNASVFYSHSYTFGAALPFTLTGVSGYYEFNDRWSLELGVNRGWGQALEDNNDSVSFHGRLTFKPTDRTTMSVLGIAGPELDDDDSNYRSALDFVISHRLNDRVTLLLDTVWGHQQDAPGLGDSNWYGIAGYGVYKINDEVDAGVRLEWFWDEGGFTTGVDQNLYEATVGLTFRPLDGSEVLKIRPEIRYDFSDEDFFDGLSEESQFTAAIDVIFNF